MWVYKGFRGERGGNEVPLSVLSITSAVTAVCQLHPQPPSVCLALRVWWLHDVCSVKCPQGWIVATDFEEVEAKMCCVSEAFQSRDHLSFILPAAILLLILMIMKVKEFFFFSRECKQWPEKNAKKKKLVERSEKVCFFNIKLAQIKCVEIRQTCRNAQFQRYT